MNTAQKTNTTKRWVGCTALVMSAVMFAPAAQAWDPSTTQAGLTQRALMASSFHKVLSRRLGRAMGSFESLALHSRLMEAGKRRELWGRLTAMDPEGGYRPDADGLSTAFAWVTAGAVLAETPPERGRNHFFDPRGGRGLDDGSGLAGSVHALRLAMGDGGSLRGLATGTVFDLTGKASLSWVKAPENDLGLEEFSRQYAAAVSAPDPTAREAALVHALLAMGGILAALQDAGEPAHVRNDFRGSYLRSLGGGFSDQGSRFERLVSDRYGRIGVPAPRQPVRRPTFDSFFSAPDGAGLADRTQRRFFSDGTLPEDVPIDAASTTRDVVITARTSLEYPRPTVGRLELRKPGKHYLMIEGRRALGYERLPGRVRFFLDDNVYSDAAEALLPEVASYSAGMIDHLLRGGFSFAFNGGQATVTLEGLAGGRAEGTLELLAEDASGKRTAVEVPGGAGKRPFEAGVLFQVAVPVGTKRMAAVLRGADAGGALVAVGEARVP
jgi:hypothetical protein